MPPKKIHRSLLAFVFAGIVAAFFLARGAGGINVIHRTDIYYSNYSNFPGNPGEFAIVVDPRNPNVIYRTTYGAGVLKSTDGGATWQYKNDGLPALFTAGFEIDPSNSDVLYVGMNGHISSNGGVLYKSTNGGDYWNPVPGTIAGGSLSNVVNPCASTDQIQVDPTDPNRIHFGMTINACGIYGKNCGGPYHSFDGGATIEPNSACTPDPVWRGPGKYEHNDAGILFLNPLRPNEIYESIKAHPNLQSVMTSFDYGTTLSFMDVVDTRASFLPSSQQGIASLLPTQFVLAPSNPDIRYAVHGSSPGDPNIAVLRVDNVADPRPYTSTGITIEQVVVRFDGKKSSSTIDGVGDNDLDGDTTRDNIWSPIFFVNSLPPPAGGSASSTRYVYDLLANPADPNKIYLSVYSYGGGATGTEANIWELTPAGPGAQWSARSIYRYINPGGMRTELLQSAAFDPTSPNRIYFTQVPAGSGLGRPTKFIKLESFDNGATWTPQTLSTDFPYFHALDIKEFEVTSGTRQIVLGSTLGLYQKLASSTTWLPKSSMWYLPQGYSFTALAQSPHDQNLIYAKAPRYVIESFNGGMFYQLLDEARFSLGEYYPNATETSCGDSQWMDPVFMTTVINGIAVHPSESSTIYAATESGVWKNPRARSDSNICYTDSSIEKASHAWQKLGVAGLGSTYIWSIAFDPFDPTGNTLLAGTRQGIYRTTNGGSVWTVSLANVRDVKAIDFSGSAILAAAYDGLYRSANGGATWTRVVSEKINDLSPRLGFEGHWALATGNGIKRSQDHGITWEDIPHAFLGAVDSVLYTTHPQSGWERLYYTGTGDALYATDIEPPGGGPDTAPPAVSITSPLTGSTVSGTIQVAAFVSDNTGVSRLDFQLDGTSTIMQELTAPPWNFSWDTQTTYNGSRRLTALAYDAAGNVGTSSITFTLSNTTVFTAILLNSGFRTTYQGSFATSTITARLLGGTPGPISFSVISPLPQGATAAFSPPACTPNTQCTTLLTLNTSPATPAGNYSVTVQGLSGVLAIRSTFLLVVRSLCGNGAIDPGEQCDGADLNEASCGSLGFASGGALACGSACTYNTSGCFARPFPGFVDGKIGNAAAFNGIDTYFLVPFFPQAFNGKPFSVAAWVSSTASNGAIFATGDSRVFPGKYLYLGVENGRPVFRFLADTLTGTGELPGGWVHLVFVWDGPGTKRKIYVNGSLAAEDASPPAQSLAVVAGLDTENGGWVGKGYNGSGMIYMNGAIDEFRIYGRALPPWEVQLQYKVAK